jgi:hypothetical protein
MNQTIRYDLLCHEGISRALLIFLGKAKPPTYKVVNPKNGQIQITVKSEVGKSSKLFSVIKYHIFVNIHLFLDCTNSTSRC